MASGTRFFQPYQTAIVAGQISPGAILSFFLTGTNTPAPIYGDEALTEPIGTTVTADGDGLYPSFFLNPAITYKVTQTDSGGANETVADPVDSGVNAVISALALGSAAFVNVGTAGGTVPLLNGVNTFSGANSHTGFETFQGGASAGVRAAPLASDMGYLGFPLDAKAGPYTLTMADLATDMFFAATGTLTIPANSALAVATGQFFIASFDVGATGTIAITTDTLRWLQGNQTGSRTVTGPGFIVIEKKKTTEWWVVGGANIS